MAIVHQTIIRRITDKAPRGNQNIISYEGLKHTLKDEVFIEISKREEKARRDSSIRDRVKNVMPFMPVTKFLSSPDLEFFLFPEKHRKADDSTVNQ